MNIFNNFKVGQKILIGYSVILMFMWTIAGTLFLYLNELTADFTFLVEHDQPVLANAHQLAKLIIDMETGERGFLITGKEEFLEPYHNSVDKFDKLLEMEKVLVSDNLPQVAMLDKIKSLKDQWIEKAAKPAIAKRREANKATVTAFHLQEILKDGVGKGILDKLRSVLAEMESHLRTKNDLEGIILTIKVAKDMVDQETGQRGFIITGQESFLEPYYNGQKKLINDIASLRSQLKDDSKALALLNQIESLSVEWMEKAAKPEIEARRQMNANPVTINDVAVLIQAKTGKDILDSIRVQFDSFIQTEKDLITQRSEQAKQNVMQVYFILFGFILGSTIFSLLLGFAIASSITRPLTKMTQMAHDMAMGNMNQLIALKDDNEINNITIRQDEIGHIGRTFDNLANYSQAVIEDIVQIAQSFAAGNLHVTPVATYRGDFVQIKNALEIASTGLLAVVEDIVKVAQGLAEGQKNITAQANYQGDFIKIKNALEKTSINLAKVKAINSTQDWLKTGQMQLNQKISGEQELITLAKKIINFLTTYLEAQVGVFYLFEETKIGETDTSENFGENGYLKLAASYAYTHRKGSPNEFQIGEGLVGQAALEKQKIFVTDIPEDYISIQSGLGETVPQNILVIPFLYEDKVKGVIEIASLHPMTDIQLEFLEQVMPNIGIAVNTAHSRSQMQNLLQQLSMQSKDVIQS
jgi:CHASE3 domain sensor protein/putative methionine-R-sulfoxide reductase with GAF domain